MEKIRRLLLVLALFIVLIIICCLMTYSTSQATNKLKVTAQNKIEAGKKITIKANLPVTFKSSNTKIATVNKKGVVVAKKAGTVKITVTSKKDKHMKKTVKITVKAAKVNKHDTESDKPDHQNVPVEAVSLSATYAGDIIPKYGFVDPNLLTVTVTYKDGSTKTLKPYEFSFEKSYAKDLGENEMIVKYLDLSTTFTVSTVKVPEHNSGYIHYLSFRYNGGYPLDLSALEVYLHTYDEVYLSDDYKYEYCGVVEKDGVKQHKYVIYYAENLLYDEYTVHTYASNYLYIK